MLVNTTPQRAHTKETTMKFAPNGIPIFDRSTFENGCPRAKIAEVEAVHVAMHEFGLVYVLNHRLTPGLKEQFFQLWHQYVMQSEEIKRQDIVGKWCQRGWTPALTEKSVTGGGKANLCEWYFANPVPVTDLEIIHDWPELCQENHWPISMPPQFAKLYMQYGRELHTAVCSVMQASGIAYDQDFVADTYQGSHVSRALYYHPLCEEQIASDNVEWGGKHTDFNAGTGLGGSMWITPSGELSKDGPDGDDGALLLRTRKGVWINGTPPPNCIAVQFGQIMEIITANDDNTEGTQATVHYIKPPRVPGWARLAFAHFVHMQPNKIIRPRSRRYGPPRLSGTFYEATLQAINLMGTTPDQWVERQAFPVSLLAERMAT